MSTTFSLETPNRQPPHLEACLCADLDDWPGANAELLRKQRVRDALKKAASPDCAFCSGEGVELVPGRDPDALQVGEGRLGAFLAFLGLPFASWGSLTAPEARRAVIRARNRRKPEGFEIEAEMIVGEPDNDGTLPVRGFAYGLTVRTLTVYVDSFERLAFLAEETGQRIVWC